MKVDLVVLISMLTTLSGAIIGWIGCTRSARANAEKRVSDDATNKSEIAHIHEGIKTIINTQEKHDAKLTSIQDANDRRFNKLSERITRVEETSKYALQLAGFSTDKKD